MDSITLKNFRCFREEQTVRLAPLTLLVGENSTGKTSFMAMIRALWAAAYAPQTLNFKQEPYDLGSFDEIAHYRGGRGGRAATFMAAFTLTREESGRNRRRRNNAIPPLFKYSRFEIEFEEHDSAPSVANVRFCGSDSLSVWDYQIEVNLRKNRDYFMTFRTPNGSWGVNLRPGKEDLFQGHFSWISLSVVYSARLLEHPLLALTPLQNSAELSEKDAERICRLAEISEAGFFPYFESPYAGAPVRSKPHRTYDPTRPTPDPEGDYIPMFLASIHYQDQKQWTRLKESLEVFGREAGLFDELSIRPLGKKSSEPFQIQVRKYAEKRKGPHRNLIDVGYGVSQVLPVVTELLCSDRPELFLLQQPEVHLHPSAQAAMGSLFCQLAGAGRQLIVETHSDHLINRVRMDVRDGEGNLKPEDVSILFFERRDLDVHIHSLEIDDEGNVLNAPPVYRQFFIDEMERSIWKRQKSKES